MIAIRILVAGVAVATISSAILFLAALNPEPSALDRFAPPVAAGYDRQAEAALRSKRPERNRTAIAASEAALRSAPYDTTALLRIAQIDRQSDGRLDATGLSAVAESYRRSPFDRSVALWRIRFCLESWDRLSPDVKRSVHDEVFAVATEPGHMWSLRTRLTGVRNRQGRMIATLWHLRIARMMESPGAR